MKRFFKTSILDKIKSFSFREFLSNKDNKKKLMFWVLAFLPFVALDLIIRYIETGTSYNIGYHILPTLFTAIWVSIITFICTFLLGKRVGRIVYTIIMLIMSMWFLANYIYFDVTGEYLHLDSVRLIGEASDYLGVVSSHISASYIISFVFLLANIIAIWMLWPVYKLKKLKRFITVSIPVFCLIFMHIFMFAWRIFDNAIGVWEPWIRIPFIYKDFKDSPKCMNIAGFYQYTFKSLCDTVLPANEYSKDDKTYADNYYANIPDLQPNEMTGIFAGKNVICVMMESMDDWLITEKYTPTIKHMMENGINFANNYTPTRGTGFTFSTEFCFNTGFYCPTTRSSAAVFTEKPFIRSIANLFENAGYCSRSFHYNTGDFYNRNLMHKQFGYESYNPYMQYMTYKQSILDSESIACDDLFSALTDTQNPDKPLFFDYLITYSAHLPYKEDDLKSKLICRKYPDLFDSTIDPQIAYANLFAHDTDEFFRILLEKLKQKGILDNTVIVAFADHYAYGVENTQELERLSIENGSDILEKTPWFIYSTTAKPQTVTKPTDTCDIFPTIINLFGIQGTKYIIGEDAFSPENSGFVFYANNSWYDGTTYYNTESPPDSSLLSPEQVDYNTQMLHHTEKLNSINDYMVESGAYSIDYSPTPPPEDVNTEQ